MRSLLTAVALLGVLSPAPCFATDDGITLRSGHLAGPDDSGGLDAGLRREPAALTAGGGVLLRLAAPPSPAARTRLENAGARVAAWLGPRSLIATLAPGRLEAVRALPEVAWLAPFHPGLRLAPELAAVQADDPRRRIPVVIEMFPDLDPAPLLRRLRRQGIDVPGLAPPRSGSAPRGARLVFLATPARIAALRSEWAKWEEVLWIGRRPSYRLLNDASAWVGQSGLDGGQATPIHDAGLLGQGQVVAVFDTGLDADMCFFRDDLLGLPPVALGTDPGAPDPAQRKVRIVDFLWNQDDPANPADWDSQGHGTHVAGSVAADDLATVGLRDPGDGMAPRASLVIQDGGYQVDDCADLPAIGCPAADLQPFFLQAYRQGARIHTNSWGDRENFSPPNIYSEGSADADAFMWEHPDFLLLFAAGNSGPGPNTVGSPATAKNVVAVGATAHGASAGAMASFSSRGRTEDGRIKPDVTAPGAGVISADADGSVETDNCSTISMSGTSMATPTAAGLAALVREYFEKGFYPTGRESLSDALSASAALLKAALIASARPMEELSPPPPSDDQGWGRILLDDVLYLADDPLRLHVTDAIDRFSTSGESPDEAVIEVLDDRRPLKVVLSWTDFPSTPAAALNLVNDLDLEVQAPDGTLYRGNNFSGGFSVPGGVADARNNVEVVRIETPRAGNWILRVVPRVIAEAGQGYAMVVTGRLPASGVVLERMELIIDDAVGGNGDGVLEPGEWADLPLTLLNSGDSPATGVTAELTSLTATVDVPRATTVFPDLAGGRQALSSPPSPENPPGPGPSLHRTGDTAPDLPRRGLPAPGRPDPADGPPGGLRHRRLRGDHGLAARAGRERRGERRLGGGRSGGHRLPTGRRRQPGPGAALPVHRTQPRRPGGGR
ncbi:MAG: S8 family serine peptidase [Acidobacteriota bacterium]|nr:S8 family serine peptidase [Acidobacteriota bacterium]